MHKPITTADAEATATTAVAIFCGMMTDGHGPVFDAWGENNMGGGVELFALGATYGRLSEEVLLQLVRLKEQPPFNFPGVYDYDVSEILGVFLREMVLRGEDPNHSDNTKLCKHELGRLMFDFFSADEAFVSEPGYAAIIERHTGYVKA